MDACQIKESVDTCLEKAPFDIIIRHSTSFPTLPSNDSLNSLLSQTSSSTNTQAGSSLYNINPVEEDITCRNIDTSTVPTAVFDFGKYIEKEDDNHDFLEDNEQSPANMLPQSISMTEVGEKDDWDSEFETFPSSITSSGTLIQQEPTPTTPLSPGQKHSKSPLSASSSRSHSRRPSLNEDWGHPNVFAFKSPGTPVGGSGLKTSRSFRYMASPVPSSNASILGASDLDEDEYGNVLERRRQLLLLEDVDEDERFDDLDFPEDMNHLHLVSPNIHVPNAVNSIVKKQIHSSSPAISGSGTNKRQGGVSSQEEPKANIRTSSSLSSINHHNESAASTPPATRKKCSTTPRYAQPTASSYAKTQQYSKSQADSILQQYTESTHDNELFGSALRDDMSEISTSVDVPDADSLLKRLHMATQRRLNQMQSSQSPRPARKVATTTLSAKKQAPTTASRRESLAPKARTAAHPSAETFNTTGHSSANSRSSSRLQTRKAPLVETTTTKPAPKSLTVPRPTSVTHSTTSSSNMRPQLKTREHIGLSRRSLNPTPSATTQRPSSYQSQGQHSSLNSDRPPSARSRPPNTIKLSTSSTKAKSKQLSHVALSTVSSCLKGSNVLKAPLARGYGGDGTELDSLEDLPVPPAAEANSQSSPRASNTSRLGGTKQSTSLSSHSHPSTLRDRSSKSITRQEMSLKGSDTHSALPHSSSVRSLLSRKQPVLDKKKKTVPTLIRNLGATSVPKVSNGMVFNPSLQKWEGNDEALHAFDQFTSQKPSTRPSLIPKWQATSHHFPVSAPSLTNSSNKVSTLAEINPKDSFEQQEESSEKIQSLLSGPIPEKIGNMRFDPVKMCWVGNEDEEEADVFADIEDMETSTAQKGLDAFELTKELQESLYIAEAEHKLFIGEWFPRVLQDSKVAAIRETSKSHLYELKNILQYDPTLFIQQ